MCGIYYCMSTCLSHKVRLSVCLEVNICIALPFTSTLGGGDVEDVLLLLLLLLLFLLLLDCYPCPKGVCIVGRLCYKPCTEA